MRTLILFTIAFSILIAFSCKTKTDGTKTKKAACELVIIDNDYYPYADKPDFKIKEARIEGKMLYLTIYYAGGCGTHTFSLYGNTNYMKTYPIQLKIFLKHEKESETCETEQKLEKCFDLSPLKGLNGDTLRLILPGYKDKLNYKWN
ncbi:MAG: hypothetical protein KKA07_00950 [Bacteroidetes bacterium]|nr:hypothetical protein [Bacteroidota bacterium]MBU1717616.1 hypothetical protein [Bacteroidota bacterium]